MEEEYASSIEFLLREMAEHIASYLDIASLGRLLTVCRRLSSIPSPQRVWRGLVENTYFEPYGASIPTLPVTFDYIRYCREKVVWNYPVEWERITPSEYPSARSRIGVTTIGDKIIVIGGHVRQGEFMRENDIWCYDTNANSFEKIETADGIEPPKISRLCLEAFDGVVYAFGGILQNKKKVNSVCTFDLASKQWREVKVNGIPPSGRCDPITCSYTCGEKKGFLVFGGSQEGLIYPSDVHFFNINTRTWEQVVLENDPPEDRIGGCAVIIGDKFFFVWWCLLG
jgi:hypothetical protein